MRRIRYAEAMPIFSNDQGVSIQGPIDALASVFRAVAEVVLLIVCTRINNLRRDITGSDLLMLELISAGVGKRHRMVDFTAKVIS